MTRELLVCLFLAGTIQGCVDAGGVLASAFAPSKVTLENFNKIYPGMTYAQVTEILGPPTETLSEGEFMGIRTSMYMWRGQGGIGANMNVMFQNGRVINKAQSGLR